MLRRRSNEKTEENIAEIIKDRFYLLCLSGDRKSLGSANSKNAVFFTVDKVLNYEPFFADFGPLNLGKVQRFCQIVEAKLADPEAEGKRVYIYTARGPQKKANAAYLVGAYMILHLGQSAAQAWANLAHIRPNFIPFRDASMSACLYKLTVEHCLNALDTAVQLKWFDTKTFDVDKFEYYERVENGDLNVIIPDKFVHFSGPSDTHRDADGYPALTPDDYIDVFKSLGVSDIIRLNKKCYDKTRFTKHGFVHHEMYFTDGTTPNSNLLKRFIKVCEDAKGMVAVHCKAGLGRTGTCVGSYMMKHYRITASEVIGWLRICRPGSVIGPQQFFLEDMQEKMWKLGDKHRANLANQKHANVNKTKEQHDISNKVAKLNIKSKASPKNADASKEKFTGPITRSMAHEKKIDTNLHESQGDSLVHHKIEAQKHRQNSYDSNATEDDLVNGPEQLFNNLSSMLPAAK